MVDVAAEACQQRCSRKWALLPASPARHAETSARFKRRPAVKTIVWAEEREGGQGEVISRDCDEELGVTEDSRNLTNDHLDRLVWSRLGDCRSQLTYGLQRGRSRGKPFRQSAHSVLAILTSTRSDPLERLGEEKLSSRYSSWGGGSPPRVAECNTPSRLISEGIHGEPGCVKRTLNDLVVF